MTLEKIISKDGLTVRTIANFEGFRSKVYLDPTGHKTIGFGHLLPETADLKSVSLETAYHMLSTDIEIAVYDLQHFCRDNGLTVEWYQHMNEYQVASITSFIFNLGITKFKGYGISALFLVYVKSLEVGSPDEVVRKHIADKMLQFVYSNKVKLDGLVYRRNVESNYFMNHEK